MAAKTAKRLANVSGFEMPQTGIPIIIRPFVVKKAFVVHPKVTNFQADVKAQWLTKTCLMKGLPSFFHASDLGIPKERVNYVKEIAEKSLLQTIVSQKIGLKWKMRYDADLINGLLQSLLLPCWHLVDHLRGSLLDLQPSIKTHWCRNHNFYQTRFNIASVLRTATPLPAFERDVSSTINVDLPGPYMPVELQAFSHPTIHLPNSSGCHKGQEISHPHTMFLADFMSRNQENMIHHGIQAMFSQLVAIAMEQGYYLGEHLDTPLTTKCVVTNGRLYLFMIYQLNTLSLQEDFGIKNIAWYEDFMTLFDTELDPFKKGRGVFYEVLPHNTKTLELNEQCIKTFVSFVTQKPQVQM